MIPDERSQRPRDGRYRCHEARDRVSQCGGTRTFNLDLGSRLMNAESVLNREELVRRVAEAREAGARIVFANGCFDLRTRFGKA